MALVNQVNIACGGHAGDSQSMLHSLQIANDYNCELGAHPSYPDRKNFGRQSLNISPAKLRDSLLDQINTLADIAAKLGCQLSHIKAHGALYNDMVKNAELCEQVLSVFAEFDQSCAVMLPQIAIIQLPRQTQPIIYEGFIDRAYDEKGHLVPRAQAGAVLSGVVAFKQAKQMIDSGTVTSQCGQLLSMPIDTLCVHGDSPEALGIAQQVKAYLNQDAK